MRERSPRNSAPLWSRFPSSRALFAQDREAPLVLRDAMIRHLLGVPFAADSEHARPKSHRATPPASPTRSDRVRLRDIPRPELDFRGHARSRRQRHNWIVCMAVLVGRPPGIGKGVFARHRDMRVLGEKPRLEPMLFDRLRHLKIGCIA
jgi:hypothetical protein